MSLWQLLFSFQGRIGRAKYWLATLLSGAAFSALQLAITKGFSLGPSGSAPGATIAIILALFSLYIYAAIGAKRLHDRNKPGWMISLFYFAPLLFVIAADWTSDLGGFLAIIEPLCLLGAGVITVWCFVELGFLRGTPGDNRFGPDPLAPTSSTPVSAEPGLA